MDRRAREETSLPSSGSTYRSIRASARRDTFREPGIEDDGVKELPGCEEKHVFGAPKCPTVWVLRAFRRRAWKNTCIVSVGVGHVRATRGRRSRRKRNVLKTHACLGSRAAKTATCVPFRTMRPADTTRYF
ncbi:hypothetical protein TNCT_151441 [Trichonephila clavata]|uniref:Uncharacterized protein n=1 Tax=Trichonephila clavata TaxID=2740835 RepID=A0A8X6I0N7_TRICU|nr:hypothetical protein TNCT_151441 [Trichonephila clavata]